MEPYTHFMFIKGPRTDTCAICVRLASATSLGSPGFARAALEEDGRLTLGVAPREASRHWKLAGRVAEGSRSRPFGSLTGVPPKEIFGSFWNKGVITNLI